MNKKHFYLALILFFLGGIGIASILTMQITLPLEVEEALKKDFTEEQIKYLLLVNPTMIMGFAILVGILLHEKVNLEVPLIKKSIEFSHTIHLLEILKYGIIGGIISGFLLRNISLLFTTILPTEFIELGEKIKPSLASRFLYGGLTEEIIMRFGLMTLIVWLSSKLFKSTTNSIYWIGILISAIIFAVGHLPIVFQTVATPSLLLISYILIGNTLGGIVFGWLYWKKGLESAFIAHIFTHIILVVFELL